MVYKFDTKRFKEVFYEVSDEFQILAYCIQEVAGSIEYLSTIPDSECIHRDHLSNIYSFLSRAQSVVFRMNMKMFQDEELQLPFSS